MLYLWNFLKINNNYYTNKMTIFQLTYVHSIVQIVVFGPSEVSNWFTVALFETTKTKRFIWQFDLTQTIWIVLKHLLDLIFDFFVIEGPPKKFITRKKKSIKRFVGTCRNLHYPLKKPLHLKMAFFAPWMHAHNLIV